MEIESNNNSILENRLLDLNEVEELRQDDGKKMLYAKYLGFRQAVVIILCIIIHYVMEKFTQTWLNLNENFEYYKKVLIIAGVIFAILGSILYAHYTLSTSKKIYFKFLNSVIYSEMAFFEKNPKGRISNRFSEDMNSVDIGLPSASIGLLNNFFSYLLCSIAIALSIFKINWDDWNSCK